MSDESESLDLSARDLMPNWVTDLEKPPAQRRDEAPAVDRPQKSRPKGKWDRGDSGRHRKFDDDRQRGGGGGKGRGGPRGRDDRDRPQRGRGRDFKGKGRGGPRGGGDRDRGFDRNRPQRQEDLLPGVEAVVKPTPAAVKALAKHIRGTGRAYALADVARMVMQSRDRYQLEFREKAGAAGGKKKPAEDEGKARQDEASGGVTFFQCAGDGSLWLSRDEAVSHVLRSPVLKQYYTVEEIEVDPPKGNFTVIAVCGMSGKILGPPNHHEYQANLARLYRERFSGMSFERYKSRIEMHRDEEMLEKWKSQVSRRRIYRVGPTPEEPEEVESEADSETETEADAAEEGASENPEAEDDTEPSEESAEAEAEEAATAEETTTADEATPADEATTAEDSGESESAEEASDESSEVVDDVEQEEETPAAEDEIEAASDENAAESDAPEENGPEPESEAGEALQSEEELARHFRENHADDAIRSVSKAVVAGDIQGRDLSRPLLEKLKAEAEKLRRGFPLPMIQQLCREFEREGLRFFKRGKKTLYVSVIRPRRIENEEAFTDRIRKIVTFVREHPRARVVQLLDALVPDYKAPPGGESFEDHHLTQAEHDILADLRWLTMEGYVIEFPNSELLLGGRDESADSGKAQAPKAKTARTGSPKKKRPARRNKNRNMPRPNPLKAAQATPEQAASESPVEKKAEAETGSALEAPENPPEKSIGSAPDSEPNAAPDQASVRDDSAETGAGQESVEAPPAGEEKTGAPSADETPAENESGSESEPGNGEEPPQETSVTS